LRLFFIKKSGKLRHVSVRISEAKVLVTATREKNTVRRICTARKRKITTGSSIYGKQLYFAEYRFFKQATMALPATNAPMESKRKYEIVSENYI
jgi:hypothetical protein